MNRIYVLEIMKCVQGKIPYIRERDIWDLARKGPISKGAHREFINSMDNNPHFKGRYGIPTHKAGWNVWTYIGGTSNDK